MFKLKSSEIVVRIASLLLCLTIVTTYMLSGMYARYSTKVESGDSARVAAFVFDVTKTDNSDIKLDLSALKYPGTKTNIEFKVTNNKADRVSEVKQNYSITLSATNSNLPVVITLKDKDDNSRTATMDLSNKTTASIELEDMFDAAVSRTDNYIIEVKWPEDRSNLDYAGKTTDVNLTITSTQVD